MKKRASLIIGISLFAAELVVFILLVIFDFSSATKFLSMVIANHLGGRLPFIAVGLENGLTPYLIIPIIIFHNTTYLLINYSLFVLFFEKIKDMKVVGSLIESTRIKADKKRKLLKKWNWFGLSLFVWIPLPWTGAVMGSYIAHLEGYNPRETLLTIIPAMWIGIISWTLWFDELYRFIEQLGKGKTIFLTVFLLLLPLLYYAMGRLKKIIISHPMDK